MRKHHPHKTRRKVSTSNENLTKLLLGVAAGGLIGAGAAFFIATKQEDTFADNLTDAYKSIRSKAKCYAKKGINALNTISDYADDFKDKANDFLEHSYDHSSSTTMLLGALGGGLLGVATVLLLSPETGKSIREDLAEAYEKTTDLASHFRGKSKTTAEYLSSVDWLGLARTVLQTINQNLQTTAGNVRHAVEEELEEEQNGNSTIPEIIKFANLGLHLWQNVTSRR